MKRNILIFMLLLVLAACTPQTGASLDSGGGQPLDDGVNLANTKWKLVSYGLPGAETLIIESSAITLEFDDEGLASGTGGCNGYSAQYEALGDQLSFSEVTSTLLACEAEGIDEQEQHYFKSLRASSRFELAEDRLTIWYDDGSGVLNFQKE